MLRIESHNRRLAIRPAAKEQAREWAARKRGLDFGHYNFATRYEVGFASLPPFRDLSEKEYRATLAELLREIEEDGIRARDGDPEAGVEKILSQNPYQPPTRRPKASEVDGCPVLRPRPIRRRQR